MLVLWLVAGLTILGDYVEVSRTITELPQNPWFSFLFPHSMTNCHSLGARSELGLSLGAIWIGAPFSFWINATVWSCVGSQDLRLGNRACMAKQMGSTTENFFLLGSLLLSNLILQWLSEIRLASNSGFSCLSLHMPPHPANIF